jgi:hypothetical protein
MKNQQFPDDKFWAREHCSIIIEIIGNLVNAFKTNFKLFVFCFYYLRIGKIDFILLF